MNTHRPIVTLTTDFGIGSPYVAQMKAVIFSICPQANVVDISHGIPPQDIRQGALVLADVVPRFAPETIHVAVIDPGVGTQRKVVAARLGEQWMIGPDNGLFSRLEIELPATEMFEVTNATYLLHEVSDTFHGRDIMAPAAAHLACGTPASRLGESVASLVQLDWPAPYVIDRSLIGEVVYVDSFGNLISNISVPHMLALADSPTLKLAEWEIFLRDESIDAPVTTYAAAASGSSVALIGSGKMLEVAISGGSAARAFAAKIGDRVTARWMG